MCSKRVPIPPLTVDICLVQHSYVGPLILQMPGAFRLVILTCVHACVVSKFDTKFLNTKKFPNLSRFCSTHLFYPSLSLAFKCISSATPSLILDMNIHVTLSKWVIDIYCKTLIQFLVASKQGVGHRASFSYYSQSNIYFLTSINIEMTMDVEN